MIRFFRSLVTVIMAIARFGHIDEWHLVLGKVSRHITFGLMPRLSQEAIVFWSAFSESRFIPIGSVSNPMGGDGVKQLLVERPTER